MTLLKTTFETFPSKNTVPNGEMHGKTTVWKENYVKHRTVVYYILLKTRYIVQLKGDNTAYR